jgi:glycosyltransferase involved in cell wall biosynthesis
MKILIFSSYWHPYISGALTCARRLALHWQAQGHQVRVATFRYDPDLPRRDSDQGIPIHRLGGFLRVSKGFVTPVLLGRIGPGILWADRVILNLPAFEGVRVALAARALGRPLTAIVNCEVVLGPGRLDRLAAGALAWSVRVQVALAQQVVTWSEDYAASRPLFASCGGRLRCILPPVEKHESDPRALEHFLKIKGPRRWIGFCGRIAREKGLEILIEALALLRDPHLELALAGPSGDCVAGEGEYDRRIRRLLADRHIPHRFLGVLEDGALGAYYRSLDLLALPSVNATEAFGLVQAEAMLQGTPVVASDLPGVRVPLHLTGLGRLAKPGDAPDLARAIRAVLDAGNAHPRIAEPADVFRAEAAFAAWDDLLHEP